MRSTVSKKARIPENTLVAASALRRSLPRRWKNRPVLIVDPEPGPHIPYQPAARAKQRQLLESEFAPIKVTDIEPEDRCSLEGIPRSNYRGDIEIIQSPSQVTMLSHLEPCLPDDPGRWTSAPRSGHQTVQREFGRPLGGQHAGG